MDWKLLLQRVDASTARAFVSATRHVLDALLLEGERIQQVQTPGAVDYNAADLPRTTPAGGWLTLDKVRQANRELVEAIAHERWWDGFATALRVMQMIGGGL